MAIVLNKSTQILICNFIDKYFPNIPSENREKIKEDAIEIADSILKQSLATKGDGVSIKNDMDKMKVS